MKKKNIGLCEQLMAIDAEYTKHLKNIRASCKSLKNAAAVISTTGRNLLTNGRLLQEAHQPEIEISL
jgi:hypothetical protein